MRIYSLLAILTSVAYFIIHMIYLKHVMPKTGKYSNLFFFSLITLMAENFNKISLISDSREKVEWKNPNDAVKACTDATQQ